MADRKNVCEYIPANFDLFKNIYCNMKPTITMVTSFLLSALCVAQDAVPSSQKALKFYDARKAFSSGTHFSVKIVQLYTKCSGCKASNIIRAGS